MALGVIYTLAVLSSPSQSWDSSIFLFTSFWKWTDFSPNTTKQRYGLSIPSRHFLPPCLSCFANDNTIYLIARGGLLGILLHTRISTAGAVVTSLHPLTDTVYLRADGSRHLHRLIQHINLTPAEFSRGLGFPHFMLWVLRVGVHKTRGDFVSPLLKTFQCVLARLLHLNPVLNGYCLKDGDMLVRCGEKGSLRTVLVALQISTVRKQHRRSLKTRNRTTIKSVVHRAGEGGSLGVKSTGCSSQKTLV